MPQNALLIVDTERRFIDLLKIDAQASRFVILSAQSGKEAHRILADEAQVISAIFVNPLVSDPSGLMVIRYAHEFRPATPIFLLHDGDTPFTTKELALLGVRQSVQKPVALSELERLLAGQSTLSDEAQDPEEKDSGQAPRDEECIAVRSDVFRVGLVSGFDLFVRLSSGRYVKILKSGDAFTEERLQSYQRRGVRVFYLRREAQERFLSYCDELNSRAAQDPATPVEAKVADAVRYGEETARFLRTLGVEDARVRHAEKFVSQINDLASDMNLKRNAVFKAFFSNLAICDHGAGTAIVASLIAQSMGFGDAVKIVGMAAMFHDIGLMHMPPELHDEDESRMSEEQTTLFRTHPVVGARILRAIGGFTPEAITAVEFHHDRKGSSLSGGLGSPTQAAEIVGISEEFVHLIRRSKADPELKPLRHLERHSFSGYSRPVVEGFRNAFFLTLL